MNNATKTAAVTADTITNTMIRELRTEAGEAGDMEQIAICNLALGMVDGANCGAEEDARQKCADVINAARAMED